MTRATNQKSVIEIQYADVWHDIESLSGAVCLQSSPCTPRSDHHACFLFGPGKLRVRYQIHIINLCQTNALRCAIALFDQHHFRWETCDDFTPVHKSILPLLLGCRLVAGSVAATALVSQWLAVRVAVARREYSVVWSISCCTLHMGCRSAYFKPMPLYAHACIPHLSPHRIIPKCMPMGSLTMR
jgi:hypothetical protein